MTAPTTVVPDRAGATHLDRGAARRAGLTLGLAAVLAIAGFTALGSVFDYPKILQEPAATILSRFHARLGAVMTWFGVLVVGAAALAPAGVWLGRLAGGRLGRAIAGVGVGAAAVQVAGLQRWLTIVPGFSRDALDPARREAAEAGFVFWHRLLGTAVGETAGYALTATFTVLVVLALRRLAFPRVVGWTGLGAAVLIATGVLVPVVPTAALTNFVGYVLWCAWLLTVAALLVRRSARRPT